MAAGKKDGDFPPDKQDEGACGNEWSWGGKEIRPGWARGHLDRGHGYSSASETSDPAKRPLEDSFQAPSGSRRCR